MHPLDYIAFANLRRNRVERKFADQYGMSNSKEVFSEVENRDLGIAKEHDWQEIHLYLDNTPKQSLINSKKS